MQGPVSGVFEKHTEVFGEELAMLNGTTAKIDVESDQSPKFFNRRSVPCARRGR